MVKRIVEVFSAGCPLCQDATRLVQGIADPDGDDVQVLDMHTDAAQRKARQYGVARVPAVAVDGRLADCCQQQGVDADTLQRLGVGRAK